MKILVARQLFAGEKAIDKETTALVYEIQPGEDIVFGLCKVANEAGSFLLKTERWFDGTIIVTENLSVHPVVLNGEAIVDVTEKPLKYGDVLQVNYTYGTGKHLVSRDTITLVPEEIPAQMTA